MNLRRHFCHVVAPAIVLAAFTPRASWGADPATASTDETALDAAPLGGILGVTRTSQGPVTVELTPERYEKGQLTVGIRVTTHTVNDLDKVDLKSVTRLEFDGKKVAPISAPKLRGHHNAGELVFPLKALPNAFSIKIENLDQKVRVFTWP